MGGIGVSPLSGPEAGQPASVSLSSVPLSSLSMSRANAAARDAQLDPKVVAAAHQFEASLMQELLKPLTSGSLYGEDEDQDSQGSSNGGLGGLGSSEGSESALMSYGSEALAQALSKAGGIGIARQVLDHFETISTSDNTIGKSGSGKVSRKPSITKVTSNRADVLMEEK